MSKITPIAKSLVGKTNFSPARLAEERGMDYISARLKDGSCAKILGNNEEIDVLIMKNGKVVSAEGYLNDEKSINSIASMFEKLSSRIDETSVNGDGIARLLLMA